ncbi:hypothetical protein JAAARDRAFT_36058 [Jaapia argillacea MUCL 33604]|uniref:Uncharacterized protein n=1 Tax=Jaapia argillacea MUCL 33604 TaxID=933084 RepID=A0A067PRW3_9AGAM|nr:hypothetical protein JAAARDRAFT_36058 [Jaapia argillacea MUCL 33604]
MASSPSHRSSASMATSSNSLAPPPPPPDPSTKQQQRRMTAPSLPPPRPLNLPEPSSPRRPPSPLRNGFTADESFSDDEEDDRWDGRSHSPSPSITKFAANFAQKVGSFVSGMTPRSEHSLPTDAELEAEAEREREMSRREAERILTREAEERRTVEERVLAMMNSNRGSPNPPAPPPRSQTMPPGPPSPATSQKEGGGWWSAAKNKLTPTKDPLTPAQQVVLETKAREKETRKVLVKGKEKAKSQEWPANPQNKFNDPAFLNLGAPVMPLPSRPVSAAPLTPPRPIPLDAPPSLTASPSQAGSSSPSREAPPLYAQFNAQGTLDVHGTLLTIAKRFEKLERWTVGHVRALEERMSDVEKWLVDKEKEKETSQIESRPQERNGNVSDAEIQELREELSEVQGRIGELGREMAKLATSPANLSSVSSRNSASSINRAPSASSSFAIRHVQTPSRELPRESASSPPLVGGAQTPRSRLPYPTGDYATPPETSLLSQGVFSPAGSPSSLDSSNQPMSISGLPGMLSADKPSSNTSGLPRTPPTDRTSSPFSNYGLPAPNVPARPTSVSPTPRKRYTVALGGPIRAPDREPSQQGQVGTTNFFTASPSNTPLSYTDDEESDSALKNGADDEDSDSFQDETIGKSAGRLSVITDLNNNSNNNITSRSKLRSNGSSDNPRLRTQSVYDFSSLTSASTPTPITPLRPRVRSRSIDRIGLGIVDGATNKFVDPLLLRKQEKREGRAAGTPKVMPGKKVPVGQLVAFFDGDKQ